MSPDSCLLLRKIKRRMLAFRADQKAKAPTEEERHAEKMRAFYRQQISEHPCLVFDVGANMGNRVKIFHQIGWSVVAVEPQKRCCEILAKDFAGERRVVIVNKAIGKQPGTATMFVSSADVLSSLSSEFIEKTSKSGRFAENLWVQKEEVEMITMDQLIAEHGLPKFIKIDVEGFELNVVSGLSHPIEHLSLEFTPELGDSIERAIRHMQSLGDYEFNLSWCESMEMSRSKWFSAERLFAIIASMHDEKYLFGDIYLRLIGGSRQTM